MRASCWLMSKSVVAFEAVQRKRAERYDRYVRPLDGNLNGRSDCFCRSYREHRAGIQARRRVG